MMVANRFANSETGNVNLQIDFPKPPFFYKKVPFLAESIIPKTEFANRFATIMIPLQDFANWSAPILIPDHKGRNPAHAPDTARPHWLMGPWAPLGPQAP